MTDDPLGPHVLSPDSSLAQLVEERTERLDDEINEHRRATTP